MEGPQTRIGGLVPYNVTKKGNIIIGENSIRGRRVTWCRTRMPYQHEKEIKSGQEEPTPPSTNRKTKTVGQQETGKVRDAQPQIKEP